MKLYLGVTDTNWYDRLASGQHEDVNFWQPGGNSAFNVLKPGEPFLFKLKGSRNAIGGVGFFSSHSILPLDVAWNIFEERNGVGSYLELRNKIVALRSRSNPFASNPNIGCIVLTDPIFFREQDWIAVPSDWSPNIVQGKSYDFSSEIGRELWRAVESTLERYQLFDRILEPKEQFVVAEPEAEYARYLTKVRIGQDSFRVQLIDAYNRRCSITGERTLPALEAAHIKPYAESGPHHLANGLLVRADFHKLLDSGYVTLTNDLTLMVSKKIKEEYENGREYYKYNGQPLVVLPERDIDRPSPQFIEWHNNNIYNG